MPDVSPQRSIKLAYIDGLRALAALFVVAHHIGQFTFAPLHVENRLALTAMRLLGQGSYGVSVFIVLSGYCLMLPWLGQPAAVSGRSLREFMGRRARRILPAYYAALGFSCLLLASIPTLRESHESIWRIALPGLSAPNVALHLLLLHNLYPSYAWQLNPSLWSIALEWQIYFIFAGILLPIWVYTRRMRYVLWAALAISFLLIAVGLSSARPWLVGLFALGMAGAVRSFPSQPPAQGGRPGKWGWLALLLWLVVGAEPALHALNDNSLLLYMLRDVLVGAATTALLIGWAQRRNSGRRLPLFARLLQQAPLVSVGRYSYSLYLIHYPCLALLYFWLRSSVSDPALLLWYSLCTGLPALLIAAYIFHRLFERPAPRWPWRAGAGQAPHSLAPHK